MDKPLATATILQQALPLAAFDGWCDAMFKQAYKNANISESEAIRACPRGVMDLLDCWALEADAAVAEFAARENLSELKIRQRIKQLILFRLNYVSKDREALRRACALLALPWHIAENFRMLHRTVDRMWLLAGDTSNDYNWYSKRLLLSGVYISTLMYWLSDDSPNFEATNAFLDRRIENVMQVGKWMGKVKNKAGGNE